MSEYLEGTLTVQETFFFHAVFETPSFTGIRALGGGRRFWGDSGGMLSN